MPPSGSRNENLTTYNSNHNLSLEQSQGGPGAVNHESSKVDHWQDLIDSYTYMREWKLIHVCGEECNGIFVTDLEEADVEANTEVVYGD